jgi:enolase
MKPIATVQGREILDSRGNPTVEAEVTLVDGTKGIASVPSGASTGTYEATELRDRDPKRYGGKGVLQAVSNINGSIASAIQGMDPADQKSIDHTLCELDGTVDKSRLGANAILAVSLAIAHAAAASVKEPLYRYLQQDNSLVLPVPLFNILNGGRHAQNSTDFQEFMVVPAGVNTFQESVRAGVEIYQALKEILIKTGHTTNVGDEGGFAPSLANNRQAVELILSAIERAGYQPGRECFIALDVAASEFHQSGQYLLKQERTAFTSLELVELYAQWVEDFPIVSIEDGMHEDDWEGWHKLNKRIGHSTQLVGDDLYTTNQERIRKGIQEKSSNAVLIKLNQIGTLTETLEAIRLTQSAGWGTVISHRSGETIDTTISDLAVATGSGQIKAGGPSRSERLAKYNRLLRIEEDLGSEARYAGMEAFRHLQI